MIRVLFRGLKIPDLRKKLFLIIAVFIVFRIMANIPIPGVDAQRLRLFFQQFEVFSLVNVFAGGALERVSIVMLGLGPYITATVILQLLSMVIPRLKELYKEEGEAGRRKFEQYSRMLTVPLAALQSYGMLTLLQKQLVIPGMSPLMLTSSIMTITAGTMLLMWLGELVDERGIGSGISLLIFAGIIADFPQNSFRIYRDIKTHTVPWLSLVLFFVFSLLMIFAVTLINQARRNIPISYTRRVRGRRLYGGVKSYLPLSINPAGVMPIIFALSLLTFPSMFANFFVGQQNFLNNIAQAVLSFSKNQIFYSILYFILVFAFTFFYTIVVFEPQSIADNLKRSGGFVPGIRPGESTARFISYVLYRILPLGALFLGIIALSPTVVANLTGIVAFRFLVGGTSLLILVSVILETYQQIRSYVEMREI